MSIKIEQKIVDYGVVRDEPQAPAAPKEERPRADVIQMNERLERPERLEGTTYKVKTPNSEHAMYITINDIVLNEDTPHEHRRPFEIFINSKNMDHFQWIVALTRIMSAVFRKGGDVTFLVEELRSVFDPHGGYFKKGAFPEAVEAVTRVAHALNASVEVEIRRTALYPSYDVFPILRGVELHQTNRHASP